MLTVAIQVASALAAAHDGNIVHRDIKPENIMLRRDGYVKVLDFGLAKLTERRVPATDSEATTMAQANTAPGVVMGTVSYMSPEQARGLVVDERTDIFSLGVVLYEMITGHAPFEGKTISDVIVAILDREPTPMARFSPEIPNELERIIKKALAKDRDARYQTIKDLLIDLKGLREELEFEAKLKRSLPPELSAEATIGTTSEQADAATVAPVEHTVRAANAVGRTRDLAAIIERWQRATRGDGGFVILSGEPGIGKTTLVQLFTRSIVGDNSALAAIGRCSERLGVGEAYLPFLEAMTALAESSHGAIVRSIVKTKAPTWYIQLFPTLLTDSSIEQLRRDLIGGSQERMRRELVDALEKISHSYSLCLVLEDLHWSDLATMELLAYLSKRIAGVRLLVIGTYRLSEVLVDRHPLKPILLEMTSRGVSHEVSLGFLSEDDVRAYIGLEFPEHRFPSDFSSWIHRKTEGNPLFMVDLLRHLVEQQAIVRTETWLLSQPLGALEGETPASVRGMIERKMQALMEEERRLLAIAAVQGESFDSSTLAEAAEMDELELEERLDKLNRVHGLIATTGEIEFPDGSFGVRYRFVHVLYHDALYGMLTAKRKSLLHGKIGEVLARRFGSRAAQMAAELALHFERARQPGRALPFYLQAADNAAAKFAHVEAEAYCTRALELTARLQPEESDRWHCQILSKRGQLRFAMSRFDDSVSDFQQMLASAERLNEPPAQVEAICQLANTLFWAKRNDELESYVNQALALAHQYDLKAAAAQARAILGLQRLCYGRVDEGGDLHEQAERQAAVLGHGPTRVISISWRGSLLYWQGEYEQSLPMLRQAQRLAIEHHDGFHLLANQFFMGLSTANTGKLAEALRLLGQGRQLAEKNSDTFWLGRFPNCEAWVYHEALDFQRAFDLNREAAIIARQTSFLEGESNAEVNVGLAALELGDLAAAQAAFERAEDLFRRDEWFRWRYRLRLEIGWAELFRRKGDLNAAFEHVEAGRRLAEQVKARKYMALAHRMLGQLELERERIAEAEAHLKRAVELVGSMQAPVAAWKIYRTVGDIHQMMRRADQARLGYATALQFLRYLAEHSPEALRTSLMNSEITRSLERAASA